MTSDAATPRVRPSAEGAPDSSPLLRVLSRSPRLAETFRFLVDQLVAGSLLPAHDREMITIRMAWRSRCAYEMSRHAASAGAAGVVVDLVATELPEQGTSVGLSARDLLLICLVDEVFDDNVVSDATWSKLSAIWSDAELLELVTLAGFYWMVAAVANSSGVGAAPIGVEPMGGHS